MKPNEFSQPRPGQAQSPGVEAVRVIVIGTGFGGLTAWFNDESFFKMKTTIVYGTFAVILGAAGVGKAWGDTLSDPVVSQTTVVHKGLPPGSRPVRIAPLTYTGGTVRAGLWGGTTGTGAARYTSFTNGRSPIWNQLGHERMGWAISVYNPASP